MESKLPATIEAVQPEAAAIQVPQASQVHSVGRAWSRQLSGTGSQPASAAECGRQWTRARHSVRSELERTKCQAGRAAAKRQIIII